MPERLRNEDDSSPRALHRRAFLRAAGTTAALVPGFLLLGDLRDGQPASAAVRAALSPAAHTAATQAAGAQAAQDVPPILLGGAEVRPPSVPLAVRSPYLSTWLPATDLTATTPQFWYGSNRGFAGLVRIDGQTYAWAGQPEVNGTSATPLAQTSLQVTATRSIFVLNAGGVELTAEWLSPIEPGDLRLESAPFTLLTVSARATDGAGHDVRVYADITGEWASSEETGVIEWQATTISSSLYWSIQLQTQAPLTELVIGEQLVPESVKALQASFYLTQLEPYGLPLQTDAGGLSKVAWNLYIPAWLRDYQIAPELLSRDVAYINDTPSLVPYGDRYNTDTGVEVTGVKAHPTLGAVFAVLFAAEPPVATTVTPGSVLLIPGQASEVTLANTNTSGDLLTVHWAAAPPAGSGITVTPASGSVSLIRGAAARTTFAVAASPAAPPATVTVPVNVTASAGGTSLLCPGSYLQVLVPYPSLAAAFDNVGVTEDSDPSPGNFDGYGNSFSATALADAGITPGSPVTSGGVTFTWPDVTAGEPDNTVASGQTIAVPGSGSTLGFLGVADNGVASGTGTIGYTDGSTQSFTIGFQNWIDATPADGDALVATTSYVNRTTPGAARTPSLFSASVPLQAGKAVASVTLPDASSTTVSTSTTSMHIFAIGIA